VARGGAGDRRRRHAVVVEGVGADAFKSGARFTTCTSRASLLKSGERVAAHHDQRRMPSATGPRYSPRMLEVLYWDDFL
jgi:hypothetical protein